MGALTVLLDDEGGASLLSRTLLTSFGSAQNIARFAVENAHNALRGRNVGTVMSGNHVAVFWLLLDTKGTISKTVLENWASPFIAENKGGAYRPTSIPTRNRSGTSTTNLNTGFSSPKCGQLDHSGLPSRNVGYTIQDTSNPRYPHGERVTICDQVGSRPIADFYTIQYGLQCCL